MICSYLHQLVRRRRIQTREPRQKWGSPLRECRECLPREQRAQHQPQISCLHHWRLLLHTDQDHRLHSFQEEPLLGDLVAVLHLASVLACYAGGFHRLRQSQPGLKIMKMEAINKSTPALFFRSHYLPFNSSCHLESGKRKDCEGLLRSVMEKVRLKDGGTIPRIK